MNKWVTIALVATVCMLQPSAFAQDSMAEITEMLSDEKGYQKLKKSGIVQHLTNAVKYPSGYNKMLQKPFKAERIGILCLTIQEGTKESSVAREVLKELSTTVTPALEAALKEAGKAQGVEILTPKEYLKTEADQAAYDRLDIPGNSGNSYAVAAPGYRPIVWFGGTNTTFGGLKKEDYKALGNLLLACDLDAFIVVSVNTVYGKLQKKGKKDVRNDINKALRFHSFTSNTIWRNQTPQNPNVKYPKILGGFVGSFLGPWSVLTRGGLTIQEYFRGKVNQKESTYRNLVRDIHLVEDYSDDLNTMLTSFATYMIATNKEAVAEMNRKNKLE